MATDSSIYFATERNPEAFGPRVMERIDAFYHWVDASGYGRVIRRSVAQKLGANIKNGAVSWEIREAGEQGEFKLSTENHYRRIGDHKVTLTTQQRPAIQCSAANTDKRSLEQTMLADGLVEFHLSERKLESLLKEAVDRAVFESEGHIEACWDVYSGEDVAPEDSALDAALGIEMSPEGVLPAEEQVSLVAPVRKAGEPVFYCLGPLDVVRDVNATSLEACDWMVTRRLVNRFELMARYPEKADRIRNLPTRPELRNYFVVEIGRAADEESDFIPVWTFYHRRTTAVPDGRHAILAAADCILFDGPLPYRDIPVKTVTPARMRDRPFGWTPMFDLLGPQEVVGAIDTTIVSNELGRGIGNILVPSEANIEVEALSSSMNVVKYNGRDKPEPLEWPSTPAEFFGYKREKIVAMSELVGTNPVAMGTPNEVVGKDGSGAKMALFEATATRNNSSLEQSYVDLVRDVAQLIIHLYRDFGGSVERKAKIAGKSKGYLLKSFTADDLADIDRVKVDVGNPLLRTTSGKLMVAEKAVELGVIKPGEMDKFIHLLKEGTAEPLYETRQAERLRIRGENEALMEGRGTHHALISDPHWSEIPEHLSLLDNPALREPTPENQAIQQSILAAVQEHINLLLQMPPWMVLLRGGPEAMAIYQQIAATMLGGPTMTPPPAVGDPSQTPPPVDGELPPNPEAPRPGLPGMPSMPINPATGDRVDPTGGVTL